MIAVIGIGSDYGDDRLGWDTLNELRKRYSEHPGIRLHRALRHSLDWIGQVKSMQTVFFIDAVVSGAKPGSLFHISLAEGLSHSETPSPWQPTYSSHAISVLAAIRLAQRVGELGQSVELFGMEITEPVFEASQSQRMYNPVISEKLPLLVNNICQAIDKTVSTTQNSTDAALQHNSVSH